MPSLMIQPTRAEVTRMFRVLGFTIRTGESPSWFEVAIAADPSLFDAQARSRRTMSNFYSSRVGGPLPAERGEAIYLVPQAVLDRLSDHDRLYYALAAYKQPDFHNPHLIAPPKEAAPSVFISKSYGGGARRLAVRPSRRGGVNDRDGGYVDQRPESLEWGGDQATPGKEEPLTAAPAKAGGPTAMPAAGAAKAMELGYDDGFDPAIWSREMSGDTAAIDDDRGIGAPEPAALEASEALALTAPEYPQAKRFEPANPGNYHASSSPRTINEIVIHITDGGRNINGTIAWFKDPAAKVSAHYVVGLDGEVVQMVAHNDVAWHAHHANGHSIGIEHVASRARGIMPTEAEYCASAALVSWLCQTLGIPADRQHIQGHSEADPSTTHTDCPNSVWNWDYYMDLVTSGECKPMPDGAGSAAQSLAAARQLEAGQSFDVNWPDVTLRNQSTDYNCWATSAAMVAGWATRDPNYPIKDAPDPTGIDDAAQRYGLDVEPPQSFPIDRFRQLLETKGPLWVSADQPFSSTTGFHAVVITGMYSDGAPDGSDTYLKVVDPWDRAPGHPGPHTGTHTAGSTYTISWTDFINEFENAVRQEPGWMWVRLMHARDTGGRQPGTGASALSLALASGHGHSSDPVKKAGASHAHERLRVGAQAMAGPVAAVGAAIAGIAINRIEDKQGAISWHLDQWAGPKRPWDREQSEGTGSWQHKKTAVVGPRTTTLAGTDFGADFEIEWDSNGSSIRNVVISTVGTDDWALASLDIQARIVDEPNAFTFPPDTTPVAAIHVRFDYHFHLHLQSDRFCITNQTLYGNGQTAATYDWWRTT